MSATSLQLSAHSEPPAQGFPGWTEQAPPLHTSEPLQKRPSLQTAGTFRCEHAPPLHRSLVQPLPSSTHGSVLFRCVQVPEPLQRSSVQRFSSGVHSLVALSKRHDDEQQSPLLLLPSSHCSPDARIVLPHAVVLQLLSHPSPLVWLVSSHSSAWLTIPSPQIAQTEPGGGVDWPYIAAPQHATVPSVLTPHV